MTASKINPITMSSLIDAGANRGVHIPLHFAKGSLLNERGFLTYTRYASDADAVSYMRAEFGSSKLTALVVFFHKDQLAEVLLNPEPHQGLKRFLEGSKNFPGFVIVGNGLYIAGAEARLQAFFQGGETFIELAHLHNNEVDHKTRLNRKYLAGFQTVEDIDELVSIFKGGQADKENLRETVVEVQVEGEFDRHSLTQAAQHAGEYVIRETRFPSFLSLLRDGNTFHSFFAMHKGASYPVRVNPGPEALASNCFSMGDDLVILAVNNRFDRNPLTVCAVNNELLFFIMRHADVEKLRALLFTNFDRTKWDLSTRVIWPEDYDLDYIEQLLAPAVKDPGNPAPRFSRSKFGFLSAEEFLKAEHLQGRGNLVKWHTGKNSAFEKIDFDQLPALVQPDSVIVGVWFDRKGILKKQLSSTGIYSVSEGIIGGGDDLYILAPAKDVPGVMGYIQNRWHAYCVADVLHTTQLNVGEHIATHDIIVGFSVNRYNTAGFVHGRVKLNAITGRGPYAELTLFVEKRKGALSLRASTATFAFESGKMAGPFAIDDSVDCRETDMDLETTLLTAMGKLKESGEVKVVVTASENFSDKIKPVDRPLGTLSEFQGVWRATNARTFIDFKEDIPNQ